MPRKLSLRLIIDVTKDIRTHALMRLHMTLIQSQQPSFAWQAHTIHTHSLVFSYQQRREGWASQEARLVTSEVMQRRRTVGPGW